MGFIILVIILVVVINKAQKNAQQIKRTNTVKNPVDRQRLEQMRGEQMRRHEEANREAEIKRREEAARREADRMRAEQLKEEERQREEVWEAMKAQGSYRSAARKDEMLRKYKKDTHKSVQAEMNQGVILGRSSESVDEDFDVDVLELENEDIMGKIEDMMVLGPQYTLGKERDFLAEAEQMLWENKVS